MMSLLAFLGWYAFVMRPASLVPTATPTASPTFTPTITFTPEPTLTFTPTPSETPISSPSVPGLPPSNVLVNCQYIVKPGDEVLRLAHLFNVNVEQITREDGSRENMNLIRTGESLIIHDIPIEVCTNNGGTLHPPTQQ